jgi:hypothetical protein
MFTDACFNAASVDPNLRLFMKLHVPSDYASDAQFKLQALDAFRAGGHFKRLKMAPEAVERNLLTEALSPLSLYLLCVLYQVPAAVVVGRTYFVVGAPTHVVRDGRLTPLFASTDLLRVTPSKLYYAVSHYSLPELTTMATALRVERGTKAKMYADITARLTETYNGFK